MMLQTNIRLINNDPNDKFEYFCEPDDTAKLLRIKRELKELQTEEPSRNWRLETRGTAIGWHPYSLKYELEARAFALTTGLMAPGKDTPIAAGTTDIEERERQWHLWRKTNDRLLTALFRAMDEQGY